MPSVIFLILVPLICGVISSEVEIRIVDGTDTLFGSGKRGTSTDAFNWNPSRDLDVLTADDTTALNPLIGECFSFNESKYQYKFCPFQNITQNDKNNARNHFILGLWGHWENGVQMYNDGCKCGNVTRQTMVDIVCDAHDFAIGNLSEPSTCDYRMSFQVPIPCSLFPTSRTHNDDIEKKNLFTSLRQKLVTKVSLSMNHLKQKTSNLFNRGRPTRRELEAEIEALKAEINSLTAKKSSKKSKK